MYNFYFKRSNGEEVLLLENCTEEEAMLKMKIFLKEHNFKSYYTRVYAVNNIKHYDVGSHTEEFLLKEII